MRLFAPDAPLRVWIAACLLSVVPDADAALHHAGVPYEHPFGHRGFTHSLLFAAVGAGIAMAIVRERRAYQFFLLFAIGASHGVMDAMTTGGRGTAFFFPDNTRYFLPLRPILVGPISISGFFSGWGLRVIFRELWIVWLPSLVLLASVEYARSRRGESEERQA
jgi:inner membrane protein